MAVNENKTTEGPSTPEQNITSIRSRNDTAKKNSSSSLKLSNGSKVRRRLTYGDLSVTKEIAQQDRTPIKKPLPPSPKTPIKKPLPPSPKTPRKKPPSPRTPSTRSKARRRLNYGLPVISEIAEQANREMSPANREMLSKKINGKPTPPNVTSLFAQIDPVSGKLNASSRYRLQRAHSMANSVASLTNNNPNKITTMYNVENALIKLRGELDNKQKLSVNQLKTIANLERQLQRSKEKHARATELIKEHMLEESVPIIITKTSTEEINKLTREMEKLKGVSNSERSKLLGLIVSLTKKQKGLRNTLSKLKNVAVSKKSNVDKFKKELQDYKTKIQNYENLVKKLRENASTQKPTKKTPVKPPKTNSLSNINMRRTVQTELFPTGSDIKTSTPTTPNNQTIKTTKPPSIKEQYYKAKLEGVIEASKKRNERRKREGTPRARRSLEPIFNKMAKSPKTPPGITKSNLQQFLAPFKQPISIQFAPSIKATGGNATVIQIKNKKNDDKKKKPIKKFNILADPASAYHKSVVASKRKEIMPKLRTPTVGQRKKHVIELIDKELRLMKVPKDIERKMISLYSKVLSEKQIKQLFGGRSTGDVKKILKKQVDYFKKKKR
jgi:hypothetical protein